MLNSQGLRLSIALLTTVLAGTAVAGTASLTGPGFTIRSQGDEAGITRIEVAYPGPAGPVSGSLFLPAGSGPAAAVLFCHSGEGIDEAVAGRCADLARDGYVVLAPAYGTAHSRFDVDSTAVDAVLAGDAALRRHPRVADNAVGIVGSSHGSLVALLAEAEAGPRHFRCIAHAAGNRGAQDRAADIKAPLLVQVGRKDVDADYQEARFMAIDIQHAGNSAVTIKEYTMVGHDFWFWTDADEHGVDAVNQAAWAWDDMSDFLARHLRVRGAVNAR